MLTTEMRLHFNDECPSIGSGIRFVTVRRGKKWVYLKPRAGGRWSKMRLDVFDVLFATSKAAAKRAMKADDSINREVRKLLAGVT